MQFLSLTHYPHHAFIYTSEPENAPAAPQTGPVNGIAPDHSPALPMVMTTVPPSAAAGLFQHFTYACQPLWSHRLTVSVNGVMYDIGDFRVRVGDVRQTFPTARVRGTVVEIEWRGPSVVEGGLEGFVDAVREEDVDAEYAATAGLIREFWGRLGMVGREAILIPGVGCEVKERLGRKVNGGKGQGGEEERADEDPDPSAGTDVARQFMEVLRFNR
jgi:hypothetical protein